MNSEPATPPEELCEQSLLFLKKVLDETSKTEHDIRQDFVHRNGTYIFHLADDVVCLEDQGRAHSPPILIRGLLEHLFSLVAASKQPMFVEKKMIYDLEKDANNRKEWLEKAASFKDPEIAQEVLETKKDAAELRKKFGIEKSERLMPKECAAAAGMEKTYYNTYADYCLYAHASTMAYIQNLFGMGSTRRTHTLIFVVVTASLHILKTIPTIHTDALIAEYNSLAKRQKALIPEFQRLSVGEIGGDGKSLLRGKRTNRNQAN